MSLSPRRSTVACTVTLAAGLALTACGGGSPNDSSSTTAGATASGAAPVSQGASQVNITLTNDGDADTCEIDHPSAKAGAVTFTVINKSATAITEVELQSNQRIIGEKENLAPGLAPVKFTATLTGGTYQVYCPGAKQAMQDFSVTGQATGPTAGSVQAVLAKGTSGYGVYVAGVIGDMGTAVTTLKKAVDSGNVADAKAKYALARPFYEKIESDVDGFVLPGSDPTSNKGNLDYLIDMRGSNLDPEVGWHGFHAIERDLWKNGKITAGTKKQAAALQTDVKTLGKLSEGLTYKPEDLANGAAGLLEEVQTTKIKGEEEAFSHLDLVDFEANVEGAQQAFAFLKPGLTEIDPTLTKTVTAQFKVVERLLDKYRDPSKPGGLVAWTPELRQADAPMLSKSVQGLQDPLSRMAEKVATAQ
ncbi:iron uptake system protein EfeO [Leekyejoonella antrihumi]|uniref:iron uptake system protein EfeO n=1 Tax=Leekyejoonella antrihumi TaxID=1660198 RepID=UPI001FE6D06D|nr:iron uptake system protein EfeO [Leekyejoonella antrihumi]